MSVPVFASAQGIARRAQGQDFALALTRRRFSVAAGAAALTGCAPHPSGVSRIRIGYQKSGVFLPAKSRGLVARALHPIALDWLEFPSGPPMLEAMSAGAVDFGTTGDAPPIFAQAAGARLKYVAVQPVTGESEGLLTPPDSPLKDARELKGKRVAVTRGTSSHVFLLKVLKSVGLAWSDIQPVFLAPADAAAAFSRKAFDAWATWDPYLALAQRDQKARVLISGVGLPLSDAFFLASDQLIDQAPAAAVTLLTALRAEAQWSNAHEAELVKLVSAAEGLPADIVQTSLRRGPFAVEPVTPGALARQQISADAFAGLGVISRIRVADAAWTGFRPP
jgi:sulfonate transport system substrate-binding protein